MIKELMHAPIFLAGKSKNTTMIRLVYKREFFDVWEMKPGAKLVTTISDDGTIVFKEYAPGSRKVKSTRKGRCTVEEYETLCAKIEACIESADRLDIFVDDASEELKIYHSYSRVQTVDRGLGNEHVSIGHIMNAFLDGVKTDD